MHPIAAEEPGPPGQSFLPYHSEATLGNPPSPTKKEEGGFKGVLFLACLFSPTIYYLSATSCRTLLPPPEYGSSDTKVLMVGISLCRICQSTIKFYSLVQNWTIWTPFAAVSEMCDDR